MKKTLKHFPVIILLLFCYAANAQNSSAHWTAWQQHSCYKGLSISVKNMGYNKDNKAYYWGVRIQNSYDKPVTFRYLLSVGGEKDNASKNYYQVAWKLPKGSIHTDGGDAFTANMFKSPSDNWVVMIGELCFDGMRCGGNDDCYASCDVVEKKINQLCGLEDAPEQTNNNAQDTYTVEKGTAPDTDGDKKNANDYNGQYSKWEQEGKDVVMTIGISETGIFWKEKEGQPPVFFKNIKPGVFRYDKGDDFMIVIFESDERLSLWNNGSLVGYFKNPALAKKPEPKKEETVKTKPDENKPAPVTENKTVTNKGGVTGKWYVTYFGLGAGDYSITIEDLGGELKMKFMLEPNPLGGEGIVNSSGTIVTAKKSSPYNGQWKDIIGAPVWEGIYPEYGIMVPCSWIYIGTVGKEQLVMVKKEDGFVRKFYRNRHSQGY